MKRAQRLYAAQTPDGWLDPYSFAPRAHIVRAQVGQQFAAAHETPRKGWQTAKREIGYRVVKVKARVIK